MMCFRDMTFCGGDCKNKKCFRYFGDEQRESAKIWWGGDDAPVAFSDFTKSCEDYTNA